MMFIMMFMMMMTIGDLLRVVMAKAWCWRQQVLSPG